MDATRVRAQDGAMNETPPQAEQTEPGFDPHKVRGIADVKRSTDDQMVAGVCSGVAKYLNIDPVILRVILAALTFVGFAGIILYVAGWLLLPAEDEEKSIAAGWFKLDQNEEQFRVVGLIVAAILAFTTGTGIIDGDWGQPFPWFGILVLAVLYFLVIRPAQRRKNRPSTYTFAEPVAGPDGDAVTQVLTPEPELKTPWSPMLTLVTLSAALIALGGVAAYANANESLPWTTYAVAALGVIAVGLLIGTWFGNGGLLILIGSVIALALAVSALLPSSQIGHDVYPGINSTVPSSIQMGIGRLDVNFNRLDNPEALHGRTIDVENGIGSTRIVVPRDLNVEVNAKLTAGEIRVFGRKTNGTETDLNYPADDELAPKLTLNINQTLGDIEVIEQ